MLRSLTALFRWWGSEQINISPKHLIFITGCDSGLGHLLAIYCHSLNMTVISACHNINSQGARILQNLNSQTERMMTLELDLLKEETILYAKDYTEKLIRNSKDGPNNYELMAVVNNAGVMCFGEYEWQTWQQIDTQIQVNLLGTMRLTKEFIPLLRKQQYQKEKRQSKELNHRARIINIISHCALQALPNVSVYAASKSALKCWTDALRMELKQYNIHAINFIPGGFITESNLLSRHRKCVDEMYENFTKEQRHFYGEYFNRFNNYINAISQNNPPNKLQDKKLLRKFHNALTDTEPKITYIHENWRYKFYRILFQYCPQCMISWLVKKFVSLPTYN